MATVPVTRDPTDHHDRIRDISRAVRPKLRQPTPSAGSHTPCC